MDKHGKQKLDNLLGNSKIITPNQYNNLSTHLGISENKTTRILKDTVDNFPAELLPHLSLMVGKDPYVLIMEYKLSFAVASHHLVLSLKELHDKRKKDIISNHNDTTLEENKAA